MTQTQIVQLGFYHPSNANWNYRIWLVIDDTGAKLYKETFGGDSRMIDKLEKTGIKVKKLFGVAFNGQYKGREVAKMEDIESYNGKNY